METYKKISVENFERLLNALSDPAFYDLDQYDLLLHSSGGQSKKFYRELSSNQKVEVLWTGWPGPKWTKIFSFIDGQAGIIKLLDLSILPELYQDLAVMSYTDLIYLPKERTQELRQSNYLSRKEDLSPDNIISTAEAFYISADNFEPFIYEGEECFFYDFGVNNEASEALREMINAPVID